MCVSQVNEFTFEFSNKYEYIYIYICFFVSFGYNVHRFLKYVCFVNIFIYCTVYRQGFHFRIESFTLKALRRTWPWCHMLSWKPGLKCHGASVANRPCTRSSPQNKGHIGRTDCTKWATSWCPTLHILQWTCWVVLRPNILSKTLFALICDLHRWNLIRKCQLNPVGSSSMGIGGNPGSAAWTRPSAVGNVGK